MKILPTRQDLIKAVIEPNTTGVEVGVFCGDFSGQLLKYPIKRLYMVDPWATYDEFRHDPLNSEKSHNYAYNRVITDLAPDIATGRAVVKRGLSADVARSFKEPCIHWAYIDGNHLRRYALQDLELWSNLLYPGGFIMGHDFVDNTPDCGVQLAVMEFCVKYGWELEYVTSPHNPPPVTEWENIPSFCLRKLPRR
jgi:hypothetical protein